MHHQLAMLKIGRELFFVDYIHSFFPFMFKDPVSLKYLSPIAFSRPRLFKSIFQFHKETRAGLFKNFWASFLGIFLCLVSMMTPLLALFYFNLCRTLHYI